MKKQTEGRELVQLDMGAGNKALFITQDLNEYGIVARALEDEAAACMDLTNPLHGIRKGQCEIETGLPHCAIRVPRKLPAHYAKLLSVLPVHYANVTVEAEFTNGELFVGGVIK